MTDRIEGVPGRYWRRLADGRIQCDVCPRECKLQEGQRGLCFVRARSGDVAAMVNWAGRARAVASSPHLDPARLGDIVARVLPRNYSGATCLHKALVLLRLLSTRGVAADFVVGLPQRAENHEAHAWLEVEGDSLELTRGVPDVELSALWG